MQAFRIFDFVSELLPAFVFLIGDKVSLILPE